MAPHYIIMGTNGIGSIGVYAMYLTIFDTCTPDLIDLTETTAPIGQAFDYTLTLLPDLPYEKPKQYQNFKYNLIHYKVEQVCKGFIQSHKHMAPPLAQHTRQYNPVT